MEELESRKAAALPGRDKAAFETTEVQAGEGDPGAGEGLFPSFRSIPASLMVGNLVAGQHCSVGAAFWGK